MDWLLPCPMVREHENAQRQAADPVFGGKGNHARVMKKIRKRLAGLTLTELLCVMAIITLLAAMYLGAVIRAFVRVKKFLQGM